MFKYLINKIVCVWSYKYKKMYYVLKMKEDV
jgi:hypothetical protein